MKKKSVMVLSKILFFFLLTIVFLFMINVSATVFAESGASSVDDAVKKIIEDYKFDESTSLLLVQPAVCYITTIYSAYVYDPVISQWSAKFTYGPFNGTGFVVNPETGNIITSGDLVDDRETDEVSLKNAILDAYIFETYPEDYYELSDTDWTTIYNGFDLKGENTDVPDRDVWVQFNTATVSIPDSPDKNHMRAEVVSISDSTQGNIAVLKVTPSVGRALSSVIIGDSSNIGIADSIIIMGYPWTADYGQDDTLSPTVVKGSISGKKIVNGKSVFQAMVYAVDGNSGSPVFGPDGTIIGMLTTGTDNMTNFLRPSNEIKFLFEGENKLGDVDKEWRSGLALYMQNHYEEAIKHFNAVLNLSSGHLLAQEYKAKAQSNMGSNVPITVETAPATVAETTALETAPQESIPQTSSLLSSLMAASLFGLSPLYTYLIFGGALLLLILLIVLIAVLFRGRKPKKTAPDVILSKGPIYIASVNPPVSLNQPPKEHGDIKMIEASGLESDTEEQAKESGGKEQKTEGDFPEASGGVKDFIESAAEDMAEGSPGVSETAGEDLTKKGRKTKKPGLKDKKQAKEESGEEKKEESSEKEFCANCGLPVLKTNVFCPNCGNKLK